MHLRAIARRVVELPAVLGEVAPVRGGRGMHGDRFEAPMPADMAALVAGFQNLEQNVK